MSKARAAVVLAVATMAAAALPATASAEQFCYGTVEADQEQQGADQTARFTFGCRERVRSFAVVSQASLGSFPVLADVVEPDRTTLVADDRFGECEGTIPGFWFSCKGSYQGSLGRFVTATLEPLEGACARNRLGYLKLSVSVVVDAPNGFPSVYPIGKPRNCPKPAGTAKKRRAPGRGR